ncbi:MAG: CoA-binding protein [Candidatus Bathyarchaeota archaeon]|nr:CoA-binding protein [Candidatus Bathyarchaeota archaeon]
MSREEIKEILTRSKTVAVVGLSRDPNKDSYRISEYLKEHGFHIVPVNPFADEVLGKKSYKNLLDIPVELQKTIDVVDIFRPAEDVPLIVEQAATLKARHGKPSVIWMQLGIVNKQAAMTAKKAGFTVVMNRCMMVEHMRLAYG